MSFHRPIPLCSWFSLLLVLPTQLFLLFTPVSSWSIHGQHRMPILSREKSSLQRTFLSAKFESIEDLVKVQVTSASGLSEDEISVVLEAIQDGYANGLGIEVAATDMMPTFKPATGEARIETKTIGALGRVLVLYTNLDDDTIEALLYAIAEEMDQRLYATPPLLRQPVLISIRNTSVDPLDLGAIVENEVEQYELVKAVGNANGSSERVPPPYVQPTLNVVLDGATTTDEIHQTTFWDTSNLVVFDGLVSESLRERLLQVVLGGKENALEWDDVAHGPNPKRWVRGGLSDIPDEDDKEYAQGGCWGLPEESIDEICFQDHDAIQEFEEILSQVVFPQFVVTRLPEAVFGASVSPLTANAPTVGDAFDFHIDGDPNQTPPSPWTDVFGRYPNRLKGKPRFMSCVLYLNEEWHEDWGAPTNFLDPPTEEVYEVIPKPGRFVLADQDCRHTVVAPNESAGKRPRYSIVWKLVLHPRTPDQDMMDLEAGREWPSPIVIGSAAEGAAH
jgi:hypothetical protein